MITPSFGLTATERVLPRLALDWTTGLAQPGVDVTRAGVATFVGSNGLVQSASVNTQRIDWSTGTAGLLVEESRANICIRSEEFNAWNNSGTPTVSANTTIAPDGNQTADTIARGSSQGDGILLAQTFTGDGVKAISIWVQKGTSPSNAIALYDATAVAYRLFANITWSGNTPVLAFTNGSLLKSTEYANDWWRLEFATEAVTAANTNRVYIYPGRSGSVSGDNLIVWGAQVENGAFPTSYIPTEASTVTRNADVATMTGTNFSDWFNATEGTFALTASKPVANIGANSTSIIEVSAGALTNRITAGHSGNNSRYYMATGGSNQVVADVTNGFISGSMNMALFYEANNCQQSTNKTLSSLDTVATLPTVNKINIGSLANAGAFWNGWIQKISYYPYALTSRQIQAFS